MKKALTFLTVLIVMTSYSFGQENLLKSDSAVKGDFSFLTDSLDIEQQLVTYNLAGFSLVVFENYEIVYSNQFGVKSSDGSEKIDENTAFSTASISKPMQTS